MAQKTKCLTNGAKFHIHINSKKDRIEAEVEMPRGIMKNIDKEEAELLSRLIHNQLELVLRPYFGLQQKTKKRVSLKLL